MDPGEIEISLTFWPLCAFRFEFIRTENIFYRKHETSECNEKNIPWKKLPMDNIMMVLNACNDQKVFFYCSVISLHSEITCNFAIIRVILHCAVYVSFCIHKKK